MDQFTYAERVTDWRGNNNIAQSIFCQMALERHPIPKWIVIGAGTGILLNTVPLAIIGIGVCFIMMVYGAIMVYKMKLDQLKAEQQLNKN